MKIDQVIINKMSPGVKHRALLLIASITAMEELADSAAWDNPLFERLAAERKELQELMELYPQ